MIYADLNLAEKQELDRIAARLCSHMITYEWALWLTSERFGPMTAFQVVHLLSEATSKRLNR